MSTFLQNARPETDLTGRVKRLTEADPALAAQWMPLLESVVAFPQPAADKAQLLREQFGRWISGEDANGSIPGIVVATGSGEGGELQALLDVCPAGTRIFWLEKEPAVAARMFKTFPVEQAIESGRLIAACGTDAVEIHTRFQSIWNFHQPPRIRLLDLGGHTPGAPEFYNELLKNLTRGLMLDVFNAGTLICRGVLWQFNTLKNLPQLLNNPGVSRLANVFAGKPAIIVGAGPSLNAALPYLSEAAPGFVVIAVSTAMRTLRKAGIRPDLVTAVDAHPLMAKQFTIDSSDLYLACSTLVYPEAIPRFKGVFSGRLEANPIDGWLENLTEPRGHLLAAGTVTSSAIDLAVQMGCNPVITLGFDLSMQDDGTTHANETMYHGVKIDTGYDDLVRVPGNYQETVITTPQFHNYISLIERYLVRHPEITFINATTAGARLEGMQLAKPADLHRYAAPNFDAFGTIERLHAAYRNLWSDSVATELERTLPAMNNIVALSTEAASLCNRLIMLVRQPQAGDEPVAREWLARLEEIDGEITRVKECSTLMEMSLWPACHMLGFEKGAHEQRYEGAAFAHRRWREFYEQVAGAARWTRDVVVPVAAAIRSNRPGETKAVSAEYAVMETSTGMGEPSRSRRNL